MAVHHSFPRKSDRIRRILLDSLTVSAVFGRTRCQFPNSGDHNRLGSAAIEGRSTTREGLLRDGHDSVGNFTVCVVQSLIDAFVNNYSIIITF